MNKVILMGRLTRDPEVRYSSGDNQMAIARNAMKSNTGCRILRAAEAAIRERTSRGCAACTMRVPTAAAYCRHSCPASSVKVEKPGISATGSGC